MIIIEKVLKVNKLIDELSLELTEKATDELIENIVRLIEAKSSDKVNKFIKYCVELVEFEKAQGHMSALFARHLIFDEFDDVSIQLICVELKKLGIFTSPTCVGDSYIALRW